MMRLTPLVLMTACLDYGLTTENTDALEGEDAEVVWPVKVFEEAEAPDPTCADADLGSWSWAGSWTFAEPDDPTDSYGALWFESDYEQDGYTAVSLPDTSIPVGHDRIYRASVLLTEIPVNLSLNLQSDDGLRVYVNGEAIGQWGGGWQEEGCVNDDASCLETTVVEPVDVTALLIEGENVITARVSNSIVNSYFSITPECID